MPGASRHFLWYFANRLQKPDASGFGTVLFRANRQASAVFDPNE